MTTLAVTADNIVLWLLGLFGSVSVCLLGVIAKKVWDMSVSMATLIERVETHGASLSTLSEKVNELDSRLVRVERENAG